MACLSPGDAQHSLDNKVEIYNWMQGMNALVCYYEARENRNVCTAPGASSSQ